MDKAKPSRPKGRRFDPHPALGRRATHRNGVSKSTDLAIQKGVGMKTPGRSGFLMRIIVTNAKSRV